MHFHNEAYLLPWWLKHHLPLFDHGVLIDHGSTDESCDIIRQYAPHWRLVRSSLTTFDAFMTDFEVMSHEQHLPGWKIALNVTEFLMPAADLGLVEQYALTQGRMGFACTGITCVDLEPSSLPSHDQPLLLQKPWGYDENPIDAETRAAAGMPPPGVTRNRFYHCLPIGKYAPGRHMSHHPDSYFRLLDVMVFHLLYSPWNDNFVRRKMQIGSRIDPKDAELGLGLQHLRPAEELQGYYEKAKTLASDMREHSKAAAAFGLMFNQA